MNLIVGTAGHIDHGKSALVLALTGTDPDRLKEEKARGITIELGFAHTTQDGVTLSFVDVPGHERFVRNMLAGVGGMDLVMLIVAADESVMPQTREHFEICRLLRVPRGIVVLTKADLVDDDTLELVRLEVRDLVTGSFLESAPILDVSSRTGAGIPELRAALASMATSSQSRHAEGAPRLAVDRVFSMRGFGTVVTGTLVAGRIRADDELQLLPSQRTVKVRGVQVHGEKRDEALAGERAAVNLGGVEVQDIARGETLTRPSALTLTRRIDVSLELLPTAKPLRHGARVRFHQGTSEVLGRVAVSGDAEIQPGSSAFARLRLEAPAVLTRGDRFILRAYSPPTTIAGGSVLDPAPPRTGVRTAAGRARFAQLNGEGDEPLRRLIEESGVEGLPESQLVSRAGLHESDAREAIARLMKAGIAARAGNVLIAPARVAALEQQVLAALAEHHRRNPLVEGMPREEARAREVIERSYRDAGLKPPDTQALATQAAVKPDVVQRVTTLLVRLKVLARVDDLVFHEAALRQLKEEVRSLRLGNQAATIDVATFKDRFGVTRKFAIPLLEYLDRERVTRRVGDTRQIIAS